MHSKAKAPFYTKLNCKLVTRMSSIELTVLALRRPEAAEVEEQNFIVSSAFCVLLALKKKKSETCLGHLSTLRLVPVFWFVGCSFGTGIPDPIPAQ
jgi:hypothetical protein